MKKILSKKNNIRTVITFMMLIITFIGITQESTANAEQFDVAQINVVSGHSIDLDVDQRESVTVEDMLPEISKNEVPTVTSMAPEEYIMDQVEMQQKTIKEEEERIRLEKEAEERAERERLAQIESITADPSNITKVSNLTEEQYYILTDGTWWEGHEQILMDLESRYGINAFYAMSVSTLESGCGTSPRARTRNNYYGAEVDTYFSGLYECTMYFGDFQNRLYVDQGLISVWSIGPKYCPPNRNWEVYMESNMMKLYNKVIETLK